MLYVIRARVALKKYFWKQLNTQIIIFTYIVKKTEKVFTTVQYIICRVQRLNSWTKSRQKSSEFSSLLFTVTSTALLEISISSNSRNLLQFR